MNLWLTGAVILCAGNLGLALWYVYRMSAVYARRRDAVRAVMNVNRGV